MELEADRHRGDSDSVVEILANDQGGMYRRKKTGPKAGFLACRILLGGCSSVGGSRSSGIGRSRSSIGSRSGSISRSGGSRGSNFRSRSGDFGSRSRGFFFFATGRQGESQESGEQDGIFHLCNSLKVLINMLIASGFHG